MKTLIYLLLISTTLFSQSAIDIAINQNYAYCIDKKLYQGYSGNISVKEEEFCKMFVYHLGFKTERLSRDFLNILNSSKPQDKIAIKKYYGEAYAKTLIEPKIDRQKKLYNAMVNNCKRNYKTHEDMCECGGRKMQEKFYNNDKEVDKFFKIIHANGDVLPDEYHDQYFNFIAVCFDEWYEALPADQKRERN